MTLEMLWLKNRYPVQNRIIRRKLQRKQNRRRNPRRRPITRLNHRLQGRTDAPDAAACPIAIPYTRPYVFTDGTVGFADQSLAAMRLDIFERAGVARKVPFGISLKRTTRSCGC